jgi:hypothetical protein
MKGTGIPQVLHNRLLVGPHALHALEKHMRLRKAGFP